MIEAKFFTVGTYLYKYNMTVLFVSPSKIAHEKFYIYCPPLLLNEIYAHGHMVSRTLSNTNGNKNENLTASVKQSKTNIKINTEMGH